MGSEFKVVGVTNCRFGVRSFMITDLPSESQHSVSRFFSSTKFRLCTILSPSVDKYKGGFRLEGDDGTMTSVELRGGRSEKRFRYLGRKGVRARLTHVHVDSNLK